MNAKTAKQLRKFSKTTGQPYEAVKALWNCTPARYRRELRQAAREDTKSCQKA